MYRKRESLPFLAKRLKMLRQAAELTQQQLADLLHVERCTYAFYENGKSHPDLGLILRLARIYQLTVDNLIDPNSGVFENDVKVGQPTGALPEGYKGAFELSQRDRNERQLLALFRQMDLEDQEAALDVLMKMTAPSEKH